MQDVYSKEEEWLENQLKKLNDAEFATPTRPGNLKILNELIKVENNINLKVALLRPVKTSSKSQHRPPEAGS
jgi:hypothetical protein